VVERDQLVDVGAAGRAQQRRDESQLVANPDNPLRNT
jgi:hypothetical protein